MQELIGMENFDDITVLTIDRPGVRNALSLGVVEELSEKARRLAGDANIRVVVVTGMGHEAFSAGADLKERQGMSDEQAFGFVGRIQRVFHEVAMLPMPTIAAVNGDAFGGGLELALACDVRVMSEKATVGLTECAWGIIPGAGGTQRLPRLVGMGMASEMIFSARRLDALECRAVGLVNSLGKDAQDTREMALGIAQKIAQIAPLAARWAKVALRASFEKPLEEGLLVELAAYREILGTEDRREGLRAFAEKRLPHFRGV